VEKETLLKMMEFFFRNHSMEPVTHPIVKTLRDRSQNSKQALPSSLMVLSKIIQAPFLGKRRAL
jgi:hypothetical protein